MDENVNKLYASRLKLISFFFSFFLFLFFFTGSLTTCQLLGAMMWKMVRSTAIQVSPLAALLQEMAGLRMHVWSMWVSGFKWLWCGYRTYHWTKRRRNLNYGYYSVKECKQRCDRVLKINIYDVTHTTPSLSYFLSISHFIHLSFTQTYRQHEWVVRCSFWQQVLI